MEGKIDDKTGDFWLLVSPEEIKESKPSADEDPLIWHCRLVTVVGETHLTLLGVERGGGVEDVEVSDRFDSVHSPQATVYLSPRGFNLLVNQRQIGTRFSGASKVTVFSAASWDEAWDLENY